VADPGFQLRKQVEHRLEHLDPERFLSRYSMVSFSTVPYRLAQERGLIQQELLNELVAGIERIGQLDEDRARELIRERLVPLADLPRV
jgi:kynurenine 3-monooxygenase